MADIVQWKSAYDTTLPLIDFQHKKLVKMLNTLLTAMGNKSGDSVIFPILSELEQYAVYHFKSEEDLFTKYKYPESVQHKKIHENFKEKIQEFRAQSEKSKFLMSVTIVNFLKSWLVDHISGTDQKYVPFFRSKQASELFEKSDIIDQREESKFKQLAKNTSGFKITFD